MLLSIYKSILCKTWQHCFISNPVVLIVFSFFFFLCKIFYWSNIDIQCDSQFLKVILYSYYKILTVLSVLYNMSLYLICFTHSHLYLLIPYPFGPIIALVPMIHSTHRLCPLFNLRLFLLFLSTPNPPQQFSQTYWRNNGWWVWTFIQWTYYYMPAIMPDIE